MSSVIDGIKLVWRRECLLAMRQGMDVLTPWLFFLLTITLFPLAIKPDPQLLHSIAAGIIWVAALLANLLALERLFRDDFHSGYLLQWQLSGQPLTLLVLVKVISQWIMNTVPLLLSLPLLAGVLQLTWHESVILLLSLSIGTLILFLVGAIAAAVILNLQTGGVLLALLVLPLYVPVLVFGAGSVVMVENGESAVAALCFLTAMLLVALVATPFAIAGALRIQN